MNTGAPAIAVIAPTGNSVGGDDGARQRIGQNDGNRAAKRRSRNQQPVIRSENHAHHVRHEQADVADRAARRNGQPRKQRRGHVHDKFHARHVHAQVHGFPLARQQQIQIRGGACKSRRCRTSHQ